MASLSLGMPTLKVSRIVVDPAAAYKAITLEAAVTASGGAGLRWTVGTANYTAAWANPIWNLLGKDPAANSELIHNMLETQFAQMPPPQQALSHTVRLDMSVPELVRQDVLRHGRKWRGSLFQGAGASAVATLQNVPGSGAVNFLELGEAFLSGSRSLRGR